MKGVILLIVALFVFQSALMVFMWKPAAPAPRELTPIPVLVPATLGAPAKIALTSSFGNGQCSIYALDLIGAWVKAGKPEKQSFEFKDINGKTCTATFEVDVLPLFSQPNVWFSGAISCSTCHNSNLKSAAAHMSLASYADILAGSGRDDSGQNGVDVLGDASTWENAKLYKMLNSGMMPVGRPASSPPAGPVIMVGKQMP